MLGAQTFLSPVSAVQVADAVYSDPRDPGPEWSSYLKALEPTDGCHKGVLGGVVGQVSPAANGVRCSPGSEPVAGEKALDRVGRPSSCCKHEIGVSAHSSLTSLSHSFHPGQLTLEQLSSSAVLPLDSAGATGLGSRVMSEGAPRLSRFRQTRASMRGFCLTHRSLLVAIPAILVACLLLAGEGGAATQRKEPLRPGFDACSAPSVSTMNTWWNNSPYWWFGVYLGGNSLAPGCSPPPNSSWVSSVLGQGWDLLPIWVSYQAPCYPSSPSITNMSSTQSVAESQGENAAGSAWNTAVNTYGFPAGLPIYDDIEGYASFGGAGCRDAVNAFVRGWDIEMENVKNAHAGMYGSSSSSNVSDWFSLTPNPNDVYAAIYNGSQNVWNLSPIPNSDWRDDHRSHQYNGNVNSTYGGISLLTDPACGLSDVTTNNAVGEDDIEGATDESTGPTEDSGCAGP